MRLGFGEKYRVTEWPRILVWIFGVGVLFCTVFSIYIPLLIQDFMAHKNEKAANHCWPATFNDLQKDWKRDCTCIQPFSYSSRLFCGDFRLLRR